MSTRSVNYIEYFYHVFPLHLNTFNRLFAGVINPKLDQLKLYIFKLLHPYLYSINKTKCELDSYSSDTIKFLRFLNSHLDIYNKPNQKDFKPIIDLFVKFLIRAIESDSSKISQLKKCIETVKPKLTTLKRYLENIITQFNTQNSMEIKANETHREFFMNMYSLLKRKLNEFSEKIKPLCQTLEKTITLLSDTTTIDKHDPKSFKVGLESNQDYLDPTFKSTLENLKKVQQLEKIQYIQEVKTKLELVKSEITSLIPKVSTLKDILDNFYKYYVDEMVPTNTEESEVKTYSTTKGNSPGIKQANKQKLDELQIKCKGDLESLQEFIKNYTKHIEDFDRKLKEPCGCINAGIKKVEGTKSKLNKHKLIDYIINLIDTVSVIIRVEPSEIVEELKKIYRIKQELEYMINSIKVKDIENDINNLQNLYPKMLKIKLFSTNIQKLKRYISSVECHLRGIDSISSSLKNIQNVINSHPLKFILSELGPESNIINYESNLKERDPVKIYMNQINTYISTLNYLVSMINKNINKIEPLVNHLAKAIEFTNPEIKCLKSDISELECEIEGVPRNLIRSSILSLRKGIIISNITDLRVNEVNFGMCDI